MAVAPEEYTGLGGLIEVAVYWPDLKPKQRTAMFAAWIGEGATKVEAFPEAQQDDGTRAWVWVRATESIYQLMRGNPITLTVDGKGSSGFSQGQIDAAERERDAALAAWLALVAALPTLDLPVVLPPRGSASAQSVTVW